jgi:hypothetical protein
MNALKILAIGVTLAAAGGLGTGAMAAGLAAKPMAKTMAKKVAAAPALYCQLDKSGSTVTVQVVNPGKTDVAKGTVFAFTVLGPHKHMRARYKLPWALGAHQSLNVTKPMPAASVTSCRPARA